MGISHGFGIKNDKTSRKAKLLQQNARSKSQAVKTLMRWFFPARQTSDGMYSSAKERAGREGGAGWGKGQRQVWIGDRT